MTTTRGVDLSNNNARQDWHALAKDGVSFAFFKASEGNHTRDARFSAHMTDANVAKIAVLGAYHFAWPNESAAQNAANYVAAVRPFARAGFVHWLDLEPYPDNRNYRGCTTAGIKAWTQAWVTAVQKAYPGQRVGVYGGASEDPHIPAGNPRWLPRYPWAAGTPWETAEKAARPLGGGRPVDFWQWTSSPMDRSLFYGSLPDLIRWAGGAPAAPKPPAPKPKPPAALPRTVTVRAGMTLSGIAILLGSSVTALAHYNAIHNPDVIYPGMVITAPPVAPVKPKPPAKPKPKPKPPAPAYTTHVVKRGETLSGIAAAAGIRDWHTLATYNKLAHPDLITVGQTIRIPKGK